MEINNPKTFIEFINERTASFTKEEIAILNEGLKHELTPAEEKQIDEAVDAFIKEFMEKNKTVDDLNAELTNEGLLGSILGGLTGFALGSSVGKIIARVLGVEKGVMYEMLTSRLVGAALGAALGKRLLPV